MKKKQAKKGFVALLAVSSLTLASFYPQGAMAKTGANDQAVAPIAKEETSSIVKLEIPNRKLFDKMQEMGIDLTHSVHEHDGVIEADVVVTPSELATLQILGVKKKETIVTESQWRGNVAERNTSQALEQELASEVDTLKVLRANYFTNQSGDFLYLEVKSSAGETASTALTAKWMEGESEKSATLSRKVDYGEYLYHTILIEVDEIPREVTIESNLGGKATHKLTEWLGDLPDEPNEHYVKDFVDHYMDPNELYERAESLAEEFPELIEIVEMPYKTDGYRRHAQATIGEMTNNAIVLTSKAWGHKGGNDISVQLVDPDKKNANLKVTVKKNVITVQLATNRDKEITTTAAQAVAAINSQAKSLVSATTYRGNDGAGVLSAATAQLTDGLDAPESVSREPQTMKVIRIGKQKNGTKPGVLAYSQEHAREWVTPLVTIETAERLVRNYAHDKPTRQLVNNLDIFLIPTMNPDGANYSFYDYNMQRKNMKNHCGPTQSDPGYQNSWGVDLNRNYTVGSVFDGFIGASTSCTSSTFAGPEEGSEVEMRNMAWLVDEYSNIKFAMNVHSYGGYFMWSPGSYDAERNTLPRPTAGEEAFYWSASSHILNKIQDHRGTVILPGRTGPIPDVLYSAAGNSADYLWYEKGIYAWNFEVGADLYNKSTKRWEAVGFQPEFDEGHEEAMEFSNGLIGLMEVAHNQAKDKANPRTIADPGSGTYKDKVDVSFITSEPATIYYTLDGSRPNFDSPKLMLSGLRESAESIEITETSTLNWFSVDIAGNIENNYNPFGNGKKYNTATFKIK
ncbi:M14 family metallopeptidase [Pradoshia eiseniae]|nr:M14 family metallopeptidase [Pradoshia eiseniae]